MIEFGNTAESTESDISRADRSANALRLYAGKSVAE